MGLRVVHLHKNKCDIGLESDDDYDADDDANVDVDDDLCQGLV